MNVSFKNIGRLNSSQRSLENIRGMNFNGSNFRAPPPGWQPRMRESFLARNSRFPPRPPPPLLSESLLLPANQQPPAMFGPRGATIPPAYYSLSQHPRGNQYSYNQNNQLADEHWCETCDRGFKTLNMLESHKSQHQKCNIDGCQFIAHPKVITKHIQMQHSSGLYSKISKLSDPEEIQKWRDERRRKFPTKVNIDKKMAETKEKFERGEKMGMKNRTFPDNPKHQKKNNFGPRKLASRRPKLRKVENACPESKPKHLLPAFTGINQLTTESDSEEEPCVNSSDFIIDDEVELTGMISQNASVTLNKAKVCGAITHLIDNYGSSDDDDEDTDTSKIKTKNVPKYSHLKGVQPICKNIRNEPITVINTDGTKCIASTTTNNNIVDEGNDSGPEEIKTVKKTEEISVQTMSVPERLADVKSIKKVEPIKTTGKITKKHITRKLPSTLLEKLLSNEIRHERNIILQCVRYVVNNNYFKK